MGTYRTQSGELLEAASQTDEAFENPAPAPKTPPHWKTLRDAVHMIHTQVHNALLKAQQEAHKDGFGADLKVIDDARRALQDYNITLPSYKTHGPRAHRRKYSA